MERYRLARFAHHRDTNEVAVADDAAGWIEIDPAGPRQIDLSPSVGVAAPPVAVIGDVQISRHEACGHPEGAHSIDHQHGKVTTAPTSECQSLDRRLNTLLMPAYVLEGPSDALCEVDQKLVGIGRPILSKKGSSPLPDLAIRVERLSFDQIDQGPASLPCRR